MGEEGEVAGCGFRRPGSPAGRSPIFYRMIVSSILQDKKLRVPGYFVKNLGTELPAVATLTTPNGCSWQVGLKKIDGKVWFTAGWHEFVQCQSIRVGYLLVFTYAGNSNFGVNIYDLAHAEIKYQGNMIENRKGFSCGNREETEDDDSIEILGFRPPCRATTSFGSKTVYETLDLQKHGKNLADNVNDFLSRLNGSEVSKSHGALFNEAKGDKRHTAKNLGKPLVPHAKCPACNCNGSGLKNSRYNRGSLHVDIAQSAARSTREIGVQCSYTEAAASAYEIRLHSLVQRPETTRKRKREVRPYESELSAQQGSKGQPGIEPSCGALVRRGREVTPEGKERALSASKMFQSENPFCRIILRRSYVYKGIGLHMPSSFAEKYLGSVSGFITLELSTGEKWPVRCTWRDGSAKLSKGWPEFVSNNRLEEGDVCVFELIKREEIVLKVTIFYVVEDAEPVNQLPRQNLPQANQLLTHDLNG